jgi:hypothetical protein
MHQFINNISNANTEALKHLIKHFNLNEDEAYKIFSEKFNDELLKTQ